MTARPRAYRQTADELIPVAWTSPWTPTEDEFTGLFLEIAQAKGWRWRYHTHDSRRSSAGFPDWVIVNGEQRRVVFVELKGWGGKASDDQRGWLAALDIAGAEAYLIRTTGDYARDAAAIAELLTRRPPRRTV